jgi:hypothetical protein
VSVKASAGAAACLLSALHTMQPAVQVTHNQPMHASAANAPLS